MSETDELQKSMKILVVITQNREEPPKPKLKQVV